jgi:hypothetical protein
MALKPRYSFYIIKSNLFVVVAVAVAVVSVPPHFEIPWKKLKKG